MFLFRKETPWSVLSRNLLSFQISISSTFQPTVQYSSNQPTNRQLPNWTAPIHRRGKTTYPSSTLPNFYVSYEFCSKSLFGFCCYIFCRMLLRGRTIFSVPLKFSFAGKHQNVLFCLFKTEFTITSTAVQVYFVMFALL